MRIVMVILVLFVARLLAGCSKPEVALELAQGDPGPGLRSHGPVIPMQVEQAVPRASLDVPDRCDRLLVIDTPSGPTLSKVLPPWLGHAESRWREQQRLRRVIAIIADEMGADAVAAEVLWRKAILESSGNVGAVHVLTQDVEANRRAARRGRDASSERWKHAKVPTYKRVGKSLRKVGQYDAWALGRGAHGTVTGLHLQRWSTDAPPWSLCDEVIATITAIWSMRAGLVECDGSTMREAVQRFSSGRCGERSKDRERGWDRLARGRVRGLRLPAIDPDAPANLGKRWPEETTDREVLLAVVRQRIAVSRGEVDPPPSRADNRRAAR